MRVNAPYRKPTANPPPRGLSRISDTPPPCPGLQGVVAARRISRSGGRGSRMCFGLRRHCSDVVRYRYARAGVALEIEIERGKGKEGRERGRTQRRRRRGGARSCSASSRSSVRSRPYRAHLCHKTSVLHRVWTTTHNANAGRKKETGTDRSRHFAPMRSSSRQVHPGRAQARNG